jgi:hypothetical protein
MKAIAMIVLFASLSFTAQRSRGEDNACTPQKPDGRPISEKIKGVTLENLQLYPGLDKKEREKYDTNLTNIIHALERHSEKKPDDIQHWTTARVVFDLVDSDIPQEKQHPDNYLNAGNYREAVSRIFGARSFVMGEILDSQAMKQCDLQCYKQRTVHYLDVLGGVVDIWEVGNEINGEWAGNIKDNVQKIKEASCLVKQRGKRTALTLYYNTPTSCEKPPEYEMFRWLTDNQSELSEMKLDYVFISYYQDHCGGFDPYWEHWKVIFEKLAEIFPGSKLGFGESGMIEADDDGGCVSGNEGEKRRRINNYYDLIHHKLLAQPGLKDKYVGGYFWWCYRNDMVPASRSSWRHLNNAFSTWQVSSDEERR